MKHTMYFSIQLLQGLQWRITTAISLVWRFVTTRRSFLLVVLPIGVFGSAVESAYAASGGTSENHCWELVNHG